MKDLLLPGTMCYWKGNFDKVIDELAKDFYVVCVAYTGFDMRHEELLGVFIFIVILFDFLLQL